MTQILTQILTRYVFYSIAALGHLMCNYSGLSFHNRLAFLVPDLDFLEKFQPALQEKLTTDFGQRHFGIAKLPGRFKRLQKTMERSSMLSMGKSTSFLWPCSIAMLVKFTRGY